MSDTFQYPCGPLYPGSGPIDFRGEVADYPYLGVYAMEATQRFMLGTRCIKWDGRVYKYAKAGATFADSEHVAWSYGPQHIAYSVSTTPVAVGANKVTVVVAISDGKAGTGAILADELAGGYILIYTATSTLNMGIIGNTANPAGAGSTVITLDNPVPLVLPITTTKYEVLGNPCNDVRVGNSGGFSGHIGLPTRILTTTYPFGWLQSWGPCWISPQAGVGASHDANQVVIRHDGSIDIHTAETTYTQDAQHAGFVLAHAQDNTQGAPFVFLQISM